MIAKLFSMIPTQVYVAIAAAMVGIGIACSIAYGGYRFGVDATEAKYLNKSLTDANNVIVRDRIIEKIVPQIVTKYVQTTTTVEVSHETVVKEIADVLDEHCVMPHGFAELLVAFANASDGHLPDSAAVAHYAGVYGCRETAKAIADDLRAGYLNTAKLEGLQEYVKAKQLATSTTTKE